MNPVLIILVIFAAVVLWFLLSFAFFPFGKFLYQIGKDAFDEMNRKDKKEKENEE